jgi:hypothetical protein
LWIIICNNFQMSSAQLLWEVCVFVSRFTLLNVSFCSQWRCTCLCCSSVTLVFLFLRSLSKKSHALYKYGTGTTGITSVMQRSFTAVTLRYVQKSSLYYGHHSKLYQCETPAFGCRPCWILTVVQRFSKRCSFHPQGDYVFVLTIINLLNVTLNMATTMSAKTMENRQHLMRPITESQSFTFISGHENLKTTHYK